jgi:O-succinylbenzoate synthase
LIVRIDAVELRRVTLPMVTPFVTPHGVERERSLVVVRVLGASEGWAECSALSTPTYTAEWTGGAEAVLREHLVPRLLAGEPLESIAGHRMAKAALRTAVLDARLRADGTSLAHHLGASRSHVPCGIALGLDATPHDVGRAVDEGYLRVKVKCEPGRDDQVGAIRRAFPDLALQIDANGAYRDAPLEHLDDLDLVLIEQPLAADDLTGHAALAGRLRTPLCLDESIESAADVATAAALGACRAVNVKPPRLGGIEETVAVLDACQTHGLDAWCGGMIESGLGRTVDVAVAAMDAMTLVGDLSPSARWFEEDLTEPFEMVDGHLTVPTSPGIGRAPLPDVLQRRTESVELLRR